MVELDTMSILYLRYKKDGTGDQAPTSIQWNSSGCKNHAGNPFFRLLRPCRYRRYFVIITFHFKKRKDLFDDCRYIYGLH